MLHLIETALNCFTRRIYLLFLKQQVMEDDTRSALDIGEEGIEDAFGNDLDEVELTRVYEDILRKLKTMERIATKLYNKDMKEIAREEREDNTPYAEIDLGLSLNK